MSVVTACGAKGDGKTDDTAAIQKCLSNMTSGSVLHFPPGTYRITETLIIGCQNMTNPSGQCGIVAGQFYGHGAATIFEWDGAVNGTMFWSHGVTMSRYIGFHFDSHPITYGIWYRQLLTKENPAQSANHDAIALLLGYADANWRVGYSYDFTVSDLSWGVTDGAHEVTLTYTWFTPSHLRKSRPRVLPCAKF